MSKQSSFDNLNRITTEYMKLEDELLSGKLNIVQSRRLLEKMGNLNVDYYIAEQKHQAKYGPINSAYSQKKSWWRRLIRK